MKLYAPKYYKKFKCIADKCDHSCCIGWEIDVDAITFEKYKRLKNHYAESILNSISTDDTSHFALCEGERCPHLDERGLCKIIINAGEEYLCDICREHPRFYNYTDIAEVGVGMSCREAASLILSSSNYSTFEPVGEVDAEEAFCEFDSRGERTRVYQILGNKSVPYNVRLDTIRREYGIAERDDTEWREVIKSLEYLEDGHKELFLCYSSSHRPDGNNEYLERALAYFIYRHCTEAYDTEDFRMRLSFCMFCERLLASLIVSQKAHTLQETAILASIISEEIEYSEDNTESLML